MLRLPGQFARLPDYDSLKVGNKARCNSREFGPGPATATLAGRGT